MRAAMGYENGSVRQRGRPTHLPHKEEAKREHLQEPQTGVAEVEAVKAKHAEKDGEAQGRLKVIGVVGVDIVAADVLS